MNAYMRRLAKFLGFLTAFLFIMLFLLPWIIRGVTPDQSWVALTGNSRIRILLILITLYTLLYPALNFGRKERHLNGSFEENRDIIEKALTALNYEKKSEEGTRIVFRKKAAFSRIMMLGEDNVEVEIRGNPLVFSGPKRDLKNIERLLDAALLEKK